MTNTSHEHTETTSAMPDQAIAAVAQAAEAVRTANHASLHRADFDHQDLYRLVGELSVLTQRLPQLIEQARSILLALDAAGRVDVDHGNLADVVKSWDEAMKAASGDADAMQRHITQAFSQAGSVMASPAHSADER